MRRYRLADFRVIVFILAWFVVTVAPLAGVMHLSQCAKPASGASVSILFALQDPSAPDAHAGCGRHGDHAGRTNSDRHDHSTCPTCQTLSQLASVIGFSTPAAPVPSSPEAIAAPPRSTQFAGEILPGAPRSRAPPIA
ncbi:MAG: DUF2946 family protein [Planctomycetota bacterium]|nr:DUF2946 family protein [Planctomycetota bacterium]